MNAAKRVSGRFARAVSRTTRAATRAIARNPVMALAVLVAVVALVVLLLAWRRPMSKKEAKKCKGGKYFDPTQGKCMRAENCTSGGGVVLNGACVGGGNKFTKCKGRGKYYDMAQKKCMDKKNCTGKIQNGVCVGGKKKYEQCKEKGKLYDEQTSKCVSAEKCKKAGKNVVDGTCQDSGTGATDPEKSCPPFQAWDAKQKKCMCDRYTTWTGSKCECDNTRGYKWDGSRCTCSMPGWAWVNNDCVRV